MQRRHSDRGETGDETLDRRIAEVQVERQRARSVPLRTEDGPGVRRLELVAPGPREEAQPCGRGVPQVLGPQAVAQPTEVGQQQLMRQGGDGMSRPLVAGQFLWGTFQDAARCTLGTQLRALGRSPGDRERLRYLKGILLLYVLNLAEATVMKVLFGMEDVLMEGIPVGCWGLSLSLCSSR